MPIRALLLTRCHPHPILVFHPYGHPFFLFFWGVTYTSILGAGLFPSLMARFESVSGPVSALIFISRN
jgi:hypothetical protein